MVGKGDKYMSLLRRQTNPGHPNFLVDDADGSLFGPKGKKVLGKGENSSIVGDGFNLALEFGYEVQGSLRSVSRIRDKGDGGREAKALGVDGDVKT